MLNLELLARAGENHRGSQGNRGQSIDVKACS